LSLFGKDFEELLVEAVDDGLSVLGDSAKQSIYYHLEKSFNVKKEEIPGRMTAFTQAIENIFGVGANFIEILIMKKLNEKVGGSFKCNESEGLNIYVSKAKRVFKEKNMIKSASELVEYEEAETEV